MKFLMTIFEIIATLFMFPGVIIVSQYYINRYGEELFLKTETREIIQEHMWPMVIMSILVWGVIINLILLVI